MRKVCHAQNLPLKSIVAHSASGSFKYGISDTKVFRRWILKYNANIELKNYDPKREVYMAEATAGSKLVFDTYDKAFRDNPDAKPVRPFL